ncbi:hypothetical protein JCM8202_000602 [Rhodotorula sphaerocarpa]
MASRGQATDSPPVAAPAAAAAIVATAVGTPATATTATAQEAIASNARRVIRGWPVGAALDSSVDAVSHLDPIHVHHPSFFLSPAPPLSSTGMTATEGLPFDEQLERMAPEVQALLAEGSPSADVAAWRDSQLQAIMQTAEMRQVMQDIASDPSYGSLPTLRPPYPAGTAALPAAPADPPSLASEFLRMTGFPAPTAIVPEASNPLQPRHMTAEAADLASTKDALESLIDETAARAQDRAATAGPALSSPRGSSAFPETPTHPRTSQLANHGANGGMHQQPAPTSSPDPLAMLAERPQNGNRDAPPPPPSDRRIPIPGSQGHRMLGDGTAAQVFGGTQILPTLPRKRSASSDLSSHFSSPLKAGMSSPPKGQDSAFVETPMVGLEPGFESAVKRFKLESDKPVGPVSTGGKSSALEAVERFGDLVSDVFAADDDFVGDTSTAALADRSPARSNKGPRFFRATAVGATSGLPLVHTDTLKRMLALLRTIAARRKSEELLEEVEESGIGRTLKLLERSWEGFAGGERWEGWQKEALQPREGSAAGDAAGPEKGKKGKKASPAKGGGRGGQQATGAKRRKSATPAKGDDEFSQPATSSPIKAPLRRSTRSPSPRPGSTTPLPDDSGWQDDEDAVGELFWDDDRMSKTRAALRDISDALLAVRLALDLLTLPGITLSKQLFSSEYLLGLVSTLRRALDDFFLPLLTAPTTSAVHEYALDLAREQVTETCDGFVQAVQGLAELVRREELSEDLVVALSYLSLEPFFHDAPSAPGRVSAAAMAGGFPATAAVKSLRLAALVVLQAVYARYTEQQTWIVEEVLGNLGKMELSSGGAAAKKAKSGVRIRTGATIQTVSTLLLHLVQTCPADVPGRIRKRFARQSRPTGEDIEMAAPDVEPVWMGREEDAEEEGVDVFTLVHSRWVTPAIDAANRTARTIVSFLLQRAAKAGKTSGVAADSEYRAVLDHLVADLLATLHLPEWPGSTLLLSTLCRSMMATLADPKTSHENNALKGLALDQLGMIIAHIHGLLAVDTASLKSPTQIVADCDIDALGKLMAACGCILDHLEHDRINHQDQAVTRFCRLDFANDLLLALDNARNLGSSSGTDHLVRELEEACERVWQDIPREDVFGPNSNTPGLSVDAVSTQLWRTSTLASMYHPLVERVLDASESPQTTLRTKAMRAVSHVIAQDPSLFQQEYVRRGIESRMLDASPAVRDASVELVGKYVVGNPTLAMQYLPRICDRIADSGLSVRRRVVKLLKVLFGVIEDESARVDICRRLVCRVLDEDDGIKELAVEAVGELWFGAGKKARHADADQLARIITLVCGSAEERPPPVDEAMRLIMARHLEKGTQAPLDRLRQVVEALVDSLVENKSAVDLVAGIKTVYILSAVDPSLLSTAKATLLLPFLKGAATPDERTITDFLLKMFRGTMLAMPRSSTKFGRDLQAALVPMLNKPTSSVSTLQDVISCFCATIHSQTQDYATMTRVFRATLGRLNSETQKLAVANTAPQVNQRSLPILCYMSALLCEHGRFDEVREESEDAEAAIGQLSTGSIAELTFNLLIRLHGLDVQPMIQSAVLTSLGFLYRAYPALMLRPASTAIIDSIFDSRAPAPRLQILRIIQDFLTSQEQAQAAVFGRGQQKNAQTTVGVEMNELVGNVEGFADSGVASAVAQRYLKRINEAAVSDQIALQRVAVDLLSAIARSGFSHPITLSPTLAALTASDDAQLAAKAFSALAVLHQKHTSILASRFLDSARAIFNYAQVGSPVGDPVRGYRMAADGTLDSLLGRWYSLLQKEKRQIQLDCLKTLGRSFEVEAGAACSEADLSFYRFLAEALSTIEYKRIEEPLMVIAQLNSALAVSGLQVLHTLELGMAGGGGLIARASVSPQKQSNVGAEDFAEAAPSPDLARQSVICGLALLLRDHLKQLYTLTDAKIAKYVPGKKSAMGDKPAAHRPDAATALGGDGYERMPYALAPLSASSDLVSQRDTYLRLVAEDGTLGALDELEAEGADMQDA